MVALHLAFFLESQATSLCLRYLPVLFQGSLLLLHFMRIKYKSSDAMSLFVNGLDPTNFCRQECRHINGFIQFYDHSFYSFDENFIILASQNYKTVETVKYNNSNYSTYAHHPPELHFIPVNSNTVSSANDKHFRFVNCDVTYRHHG